MSYKVIITNPAQKDLKDIFTCINETIKNQKAANDVFTMLKDTILKLDFMPYKYRLISNDSALRFISKKHFIILYLIKEEKKEVWVTNILYSGRDIKQFIFPIK